VQERIEQRRDVGIHNVFDTAAGPLLHHCRTFVVCVIAVRVFFND